MAKKYAGWTEKRFRKEFRKLEKLGYLKIEGEGKNETISITSLGKAVGGGIWPFGVVEEKERDS